MRRWYKKSSLPEIRLLRIFSQRNWSIWATTFTTLEYETIHKINMMMMKKINDKAKYVTVYSDNRYTFFVLHHIETISV